MKKHRSRRRDDGAKENETVRLANEYLVRGDVVSLRKLAAVRGLVSHSLRKRAWPFMLGAETTDVYEEGTEIANSKKPQYQSMSSMSHKDDAVVRADMERSLWKFTKGWSEEERNEERKRLARVVNASVRGNETGVFYYQGLHDVASVLLLVCGEGAAHGMLEKLVSCHLRDCTRATIDPAIQTLRLLYPLLEHADRDLYNFIKSLNEPALDVPSCALSWYMTWFSHDVETVEQSARLFDVFIASHPLMPLYVAVQVLVGARDDIMSRFSQHEGDLVYSYLNKLPILGPGRPDVDQLAQRAVGLYREFPPSRITSSSVMKGKRQMMATCSIPFATLRQGRWYIDERRDHRGTESHTLRSKLQTIAIGAILTGIAGAAMRFNTN
jgi:hypothetical protein